MSSVVQLLVLMLFSENINVFNHSART